MRLALFAATLALVGLLGTSVRAEDEAAKEKGGAMRDRLLQKYDANGNGKLDPEELEKAKADRQANPAAAGRGEAAGKRGGAGAGGGDGEQMRAEMIKRFDKDGDGKLNETEMAAAKEVMQKRRAEGGAAGQGGRPNQAEMLKKFDKNGDGKLDDEERAAMMAAMKRGDGAGPMKRADGAAPTKRPEGAVGGGRPDMAELLKKYDKNGDGKLDEDERAAAKQAFADRRKAGN